MDLGWPGPFPKRLRDFDASRLNVTVQTWKINKFVKSWRFPTLEAILEDVG